jgi:hypothetical protein
VLPQREWEDREQQLHRGLRGTSVRVEADGTLLLPYLAGETLAAVLDDPALDESARTRVIEGAVTALADFHQRGFTHGDAMAENVVVERHTGIAQWFDFETRHDPARSPIWQRADDLRALLTTCLVRIAREQRTDIVQIVLNAYQDEDVTRALAARLGSAWRRPLTFHLGQAPLSYDDFRELVRALSGWLAARREPSRR